MPSVRVAARQREAAFTIIELMVAMSIFLVLGGTLILFLRVGIETWRVGEERREAFQRSGAILDQVTSDLRAMFTDPSHGTGGVVDVLLLSDYDENLNQRVRFVRTLAGEMRHPITRNAGTLTGGLNDYDYIDDSYEADNNLLRAPGGLQEVVYLLDPRRGQDVLWRGVKSPIGGYETLFDDENLYDFEELDRWYQGLPLEGLPVRRCRPFANGILYLEFNFWGYDTTNWDLGDGGPVTGWDSTRGIVDPAYFGSDMKLRPQSRHEHRDDIFPSRVQVVVSLTPARATRVARLTTDISSNANVLQVDTTRRYPDGAFQYVKIDEEWIRYDSRDGKNFYCSEDGRGARGTEPAEHKAGARVRYGFTFSRVVRIPGARHSRWGDRK